jgi:hypothetical protein
MEVPMRAASLFVVGLLVTSVTACSRRSGPDTEGLDAEAAALVSDNTDIDETEGDVEDGVEEPLSGAPAAEGAGGEVDLTADDAGLAEKARLNPGIFFQPAGCIVSTREANVVTHVFTDCTGPHGLVHFTGKVVSTWTHITNGAQVQHVAKGFQINGATVDHTVTIQYTKASGIYTKTRNGSSSGTTATGRAITHSANYVTVFDANTRCIQRDGSSETTVGARTVSRTIAGFERCGIGAMGCPKSGTITLARPRVNATLQFPGGAVVDITVNGRKFQRALTCNPS